jgi:hypothetical protein
MVRHGWRAVGVAAVAALIWGCSTFGSGRANEESLVINSFAVMPVREVISPAGSDDPSRPLLQSHAGLAVTAQIYRVLAAQTRRHFVPDLEVQDMMTSIRRDAHDLTDAARILAARAQIDAVIFGSVYRFQERVGTRFAASAPASVSFELALYVAQTDEVVWHGSFDETQQALSRNLLNWWMFWRAGPHWFTVRELAGLGVDKMMKDLRDAVD